MSKIINPQEFVGWKYPKYEERSSYIEWVYMNLIQQDVTAILTYGVASNIFPATVMARVYTGDKVADLRNYIKKPETLELSEEDSSANIDGNTIQVDQNKFYVKGGIEDKGNTVEWDLTYERLIPQINAMGSEPVGWFHNRFFSEWISWQVKMPAAKVQGKLRLDDKEYDINALGYMDSNWGQWFMIDAHWNWLQTFGTDKDKPYAIACASVRDNPSRGDLYVATQDKTIRFFKNKGEFEFRHKEWGEDAATGHRRPTLTELVGRSLQGYELELIVKNIIPYTVKQDFPPPLFKPDFDMLEALVEVEGTVKNPSGKVMLNIHSNGFKEYSVTGWQPDGLRKWRNKLRRWLLETI